MIPTEAIDHFERLIYLPMLLTILTSDQALLAKQPLKFINPYLSFLDDVLKSIQQDLKGSHEYLRKHNMKLIKGETEGIFTEYIFIHNGYEDRRNYLNVRLRNRTEELMNEYFRDTGDAGSRP